MQHDLKQQLYDYFLCKEHRTEQEACLMLQLENELPYFDITAVSRADIEDKGYDISKITDRMMSRLADKMEDSYVNDDFWIDLECHLEYLEFPKLEDYPKTVSV